LIEFTLENGFKIDLEKSDKVFTPTGTTEAILEGILENDYEKRSTLDLGCGCGVIGLSLYKNGLIKEPLYASDVSDDAVAWKCKKFERIVCDVSSISDEVAKISPWFNSVECQTG
jgi:methylase of polypeptide subunit release factors